MHFRAAQVSHKPRFHSSSAREKGFERYGLLTTVIEPSVFSVSSRLPHHRQTGVVQAQSATGVECDPAYLRSVVDPDDDDTALCPKCGIDSVIGSVSGYPIERGFLKKMHDHWF
jgi:hypothetical protein